MKRDWYMKRTAYRLLPAGICLLMAAGCAKKDLTVPKQQPPATVKAELPKVEKPKQVVEAPAVPPDKILNAIAAIVNDEVITLHEVNREARPLIQEAEKKSLLDTAARSQIRRMALESLIERKIIAQKILELKIKVTDEEVRQAIEDVKRQNNNMNQDTLIKALAGQGMTYDQYYGQLREQIEKLKLVGMEVRSKIQVGDSEMREYYKANLAKYREDDTFHARHIFFKMNEKAPAEELKKTMSTALLVLAEAKGGKDFAELAKTYSEDPAARTDGGDLGRFKKGDMQQELERAILSMNQGDVSELVYTPIGFHIIKLEERIEGKPKPFEKVKAEIEDQLYRKKSEDRFSQWSRDLRSKATIEIKELPGLL
jgi:peptidyl-prolyl cis-trans isomerase SurA